MSHLSPLGVGKAQLTYLVEAILGGFSHTR